MVKNVCLMHLRKERLLIDHLTINVPSSGNPHSDMEARERAEIVKKAMEGLSAQHQSVLHMFYSAELSINQIATIRNTTPTAVKQMLLRARKALRDEIERRNP
jgi:RNA polymerase sigma factor (sigma-70 family)